MVGNPSEVTVSCREEDTRELGRKLAERAQAGDVVLLTGPLGAGKSVFVRGIAEALGVTTWRGSPTFNLVHEYRGHLPLYHLDLYRVDGGEIADLDFEGMIADGGLIAIEWGEKLVPSLTRLLALSRVCRVSIEPDLEGTRRIVVEQC
jgi:tRNA threonylcarbamoyladenosine biosynthesis protein TsaE